jgi:hypothetical protein
MHKIISVNFDLHTFLVTNNRNYSSEEFTIGDIVYRANEKFTKDTKKFKIISIQQQIKFDYRGNLKEKTRIQIRPTDCYSIITYYKEFPFKKVLPKAGEADKVD